MENSPPNLSALDRYRVPILLSGALILGLIARLTILGDSLIADEGSTYFVVHGRGFGEMLDYVRGEQEVTPPLFFAFTWFAQLFGNSPEIFRIVSLLAGLATIPLTYVLGQMTVGRRAALLGSFLVAISPFLVFYSAESRPYGLMVFFLLVSSIALVMALRENRIAWWALFAVASAATMYTHYTGLFVLAGQFAWALAFFPGHRKALLLAGSSAAILFLPWLGEYRADSQSNGANIIGAIVPFEFRNIPRTLAGWSFDHPIGEFLSVPGVVFEYLLAAGILMALISLLARATESRDWSPGKMVLLPVVILLSAPVGTVLFSTFSVSVFLQRNQASSTIGLALVVAALVMAPGRRAVRWIATGLILLVLGVGTILSLERDNRRLDYEGAIEYVIEQSPGDAVIVDAADSTSAPTSATDIVLEQKGSAIPVIRLGHPKRDDLAALVAPGGLGRYTKLPEASPRAVANESLELAGDGDIFVIAQSFGRLGGVSYLSPDLQAYGDALGKRAELVDESWFAGYPDGMVVRTYRPTGTRKTRDDG